MRFIQIDAQFSSRLSRYMRVWFRTTIAAIDGVPGGQSAPADAKSALRRPPGATLTLATVQTLFRRNLQNETHQTCVPTGRVGLGGHAAPKWRYST